MSDTLSKAAQLKDVEAIRDLFARAHDYIAQATYPGHMGMKIAEVLNFLAFQHGDFKVRAENMTKQLANEVDVEAAKNAVDAVLVDKSATIASLSDEHGSAELAPIEPSKD